MDNDRLQIGISGSYGGLNLGDEAILEGILGELRATVSADVTVFSRNPEDTLARHAVERAICPRMLTRREIVPEIERLDLFILGGGGLLYDGDAEAYLREVFIANDLALPVMLYAVSAGPLATQASRQAVQRALNASPPPLITVRDRLGYRLLEDVGVTGDIHLTADPAFLLEPEELPIEALKAEGVDFDRHLIGFSVREPGPAAPDIRPEEYYALLANAADFIVERERANVLFVPMEKTDVQHSHAVVARMQNAERAEILRRRYSPRQVLHLMGRFEFVVGMRLHFLIFAGRAIHQEGQTEASRRQRREEAGRRMGHRVCGGPACSDRISASISGSSAGVRPPSGSAACSRFRSTLDRVSCRQGSNADGGDCRDRDSARSPRAPR